MTVYLKHIQKSKLSKVAKFCKIKVKIVVDMHHFEAFSTCQQTRETKTCWPGQSDQKTKELSEK